MARVHDMHSSCIGVVCIMRLLVGVFLMFFALLVANCIYMYKCTALIMFVCAFMEVL